MSKRKLYQFIILFIIFVCPVLLLDGCREKENDAEEGKTEIMLYYMNAAENGLKAVPYMLEQSDDPENAVKEILFRLSDTENNNTDQYKVSVPDGVIISSVTVKEKTAIIDFETNYQQLDTELEILIRSSIVKSLIQIEGVDHVTFTIAGNSLTGYDGKAIGEMNEDTFLLNKKDLYSKKEEVTLYYASAKGNSLVEVKRTIEVSDNMPVETGMLNELIHNSGPEGTRNPLPQDLIVNRTQVYNNICYVDLSSEIGEIIPDVEEKIKVYSIVNTLAARGAAAAVQITVDGEPMEKLNDFKGFDKPMSCDYSLAGK